MNDAGHIFLAITTGIIGLAALAIVVSNKSNSQNILGTSFTGLSNLVGAAIRPITG